MRSNTFVIAAASLLCATPTAASDFDWHKLSDQKILVGAFDNMAGMCTELGYTRQPKLPLEAMQKKVEAYLLLSTSADYTLEQWAEMLHAFKQLTEMGDDKALANRGADALIAASKDPDSYARAQALYVDTVMGPLQVAKEGCDKVVADEFLGKYFLTGSGSADRFKDKLKKQFADDVADVSKTANKVEAETAKKK